MMKLSIGWALLGASVAVWAADVREIELRRLMEPTPAELRAEAAGRIYIYEGLRDTDVAQAMQEQFGRVENMMFIRTKKTTETGEVVKDQNTGQAIVEDDGC
jgi:hypothetical protein